MDAHIHRSRINTDRARVYVVIPENLLREVDALVGPRHCSEFFSDAVREKVTRFRLHQTAHRLAGSLVESETPGWETSEAAVEWVRSLRRENDEKLGTNNPA